MSLFQSVILPPVNKTLQDRKPPSDIRKHLPEPHPLPECHQLRTQRVLIRMVPHPLSIEQPLMTLVQLVNVLNNVVPTQRLGIGQPVPEILVRPDRISPDRDYSFDPR